MYISQKRGKNRINRGGGQRKITKKKGRKNTTKRSRRQAITLKCLIFELAVAVNWIRLLFLLLAAVVWPVVGSWWCWLSFYWSQIWILDKGRCHRASAIGGWRPDCCSAAAAEGATSKSAWTQNGHGHCNNLCHIHSHDERERRCDVASWCCCRVLCAVCCMLPCCKTAKRNGNDLFCVSAAENKMPMCPRTWVSVLGSLLSTLKK